MNLDLPTYDSMKQCFGATGIPIRVQLQAKKKGCAAFKSNRVYLEPLLRWLFAQGVDDSDVDWSKELRKEQALRERIKRKKDEQEVIAFSEVKADASEIMTLLFSELDRVFLNEQPATGKGLDEHGLRALNKKHVEALRDSLRVKLEAIGTE